MDFVPSAASGDAFEEDAAEERGDVKGLKTTLAGGDCRGRRGSMDGSGCTDDASLPAPSVALPQDSAISRTTSMSTSPKYSMTADQDSFS